MEEKRLHRNCAPHTAENCDINKHGDLEPGLDDCGHYVGAGPAINAGTPDSAPFAGPDPTAPSSANGDQDPGHGPGVK